MVWCFPHVQIVLDYEATDKNISPGVFPMLIIIIFNLVYIFNNMSDFPKAEVIQLLILVRHCLSCKIVLREKKWLQP